MTSTSTVKLAMPNYIAIYQPSVYIEDDPTSIKQNNIMLSAKVVTLRLQSGFLMNEACSSRE